MWKTLKSGMLCLLQEHPPSPAELQAAADGLTTDPGHLHTLSADLGTVALGEGALPCSSIDLTAQTIAPGLYMSKC